MKSQLIIYFLLISLTYKVYAYDDSNGLIQVLSKNHTEDGLSMYQGNSKHDNYFIILKNHGIENNAIFNFAFACTPGKPICDNEENWPKIKIYKMKKNLPEVLNEYHFDEYKEGGPIEYEILRKYGHEQSNSQGVVLKMYCLNENDSYFIQVPLVLYYPNQIHYSFKYEIYDDEEEKCMRFTDGSNILRLRFYSIIALITLLIL